MLRKLLKYEWKGTCKMGVLMLVVILGVTFFGWLSFQSPMWKAISNDMAYDSAVFGVMDLLSIFSLLLYFVMLLAVPIGLMVYLVVRFYKTMYTDEGYLTHTLPVTKHQLLISKIIVGAIWEFLLSIVVCISVVGLFLFMIAAVLPAEYTLAGFWNEFYGEVGSVMVELFEEELGTNLALYPVYLGLNLVIGSFTSIIILFGSVSLGQLFAKCRVLMAIVSYFGLMIVNGILGIIMEAIITVIYSEQMAAGQLGGYFGVEMFGSLLLSVILAAVMYFVSYQVNQKKLNLE